MSKWQILECRSVHNISEAYSWKLCEDGFYYPNGQKINGSSPCVYEQILKLIADENVVIWRVQAEDTEWEIGDKATLSDSDRIEEIVKFEIIDDIMTAVFYGFNYDINLLIKPLHNNPKWIYAQPLLSFNDIREIIPGNKLEYFKKLVKSKL